jgi:hypothetical protein
MTVVTVNGNTYSDDGSTPKDMNDGGSADYFFPMVQDTMVEIDGAVTTTTAAAAAAATSAISAVMAPGTNSTSSNVVILGTGSKTWTTQAGKAYVVGSFLVGADTTAPTVRWVFGQITAHNPATGSLTIFVTSFQGSGPVSTWTFSLAAPGSRDNGGTETTTDIASFLSSAPKFQQIIGRGALRSASLGSNTTPGPQVFAVRNSGSDYATDLLVGTEGAPLYGFLPPNKTARIDGGNGANGWQSSDLLSYGSDGKAQVTFSSVVAGTGGMWTKAVVLPSGNTAVFVYGASLHVVVFDNVGNYSTPLLIRSGLSTLGGEATVMIAPVRDDTGSDNVLVVSCPDNGTAMQSIIVTISGLTLGLGTLVATTLVTAAVRLLELRPITNSIPANRSFVVCALGSTTTFQNYGIVIVSSASTLTIGAVRNDTTTASVGALLAFPNAVSDVYVSLTATASVLTVKAVTINPTNGAQTLGSSATTAITTAAGILVRENISTYGEAMIVFVNTLPKVAKLSLTATVPSIGTPAALTTSITTVNTYAMGAWNTIPGTAVSGTDSSGRFLTEMIDWDFSAMTAIRSASVTMSAAHTVVWVGLNAYPVNVWQLLSATELVVANSQTAEGFPTTQRLSGLASFAQVLAAPEANYPRYARPRTTLAGATHVLAVTDGTKPSVNYALDLASAAPTSAPVSLFNSLSFSQVNTDDNISVFAAASSPGRGVAWVAAGPAPSLSLVLQRVRVL